MASRDQDHSDNLYAKLQSPVGEFTFNEQVARVFDDMIDRSVPGYRTVIAFTGLLTAYYAQPNTRCYDLGCSLGATTLAMRHSITDPSCRLVAVDNAPAMLDRCRAVLARDTAAIPVDLVLDDLAGTPLTNASVVVLNFTLQFVPPIARAALIERIFQALLPGGALVVSEKIIATEPAAQQRLEAWHAAFKRANGYSDLEISQKRAALENVLIPDTVATHHERLRQAGFAAVQCWFQCFNFASFLAIK